MMKWYHLLMGEDNCLPDYLLCGKHDFFGVDPYSLKIGQRIDQWNPSSYFQSEFSQDDGNPDDILGEHLSLPVFSARLQQALSTADVGENDVQYLPVRVLDSTGKEFDGFAIANVISRVAALDYANCVLLWQDESVIDPVTGKGEVNGIGRIALKARPLMGHSIVRLLEFWPAIVVSERFVRVFEKEKCTGATFGRALDVS